MNNTEYGRYGNFSRLGTLSLLRRTNFVTKLLSSSLVGPAILCVFMRVVRCVQPGPLITENDPPRMEGIERI
jgi:hypothetical protein